MPSKYRQYIIKKWRVGALQDKAKQIFQNIQSTRPHWCLIYRLFGTKNSSIWFFTRSVHRENFEFPQNSDLPPLIPPTKKPYPRPLELVIWEYKRDRRFGLRKLWKVPYNGMLVEHLIPVAHDVLKEYAVLEEGVKRIMKSIPVKACTCCMEIHIARVGHKLPTCRGTGNREVYGQHRWIRGYVEDVIIPLEAYHVHDKLGPSIKHPQRYTVPRVGAIHELCMHAGVDDPKYPMIRWARRSGRQVGNGHAQVPLTRFRNVIVPGYSDDDADTSSDEEDLKTQARTEGEVLKKQKGDEELAREKLESAKEAVGDDMTDDEDDEQVAETNEELERTTQDEKMKSFSQDGGVERTTENEQIEDEDDTRIIRSELMSQGEYTRKERENDLGPRDEEVRKTEESEQGDGFLLRPPKHFNYSEDIPESEELRFEHPYGKTRKWSEVCGTWSIADPSEDEKEELRVVAERTLLAFDNVRKGVQALMYKYKIWACGYCSEVHIGTKPHKVKLCGGYGRGERDGLHSWQEAALSDIFPPNFVWHIPEGHNPRLSREFLRFYGQAPAVVELCVQAGAEAPERWKPFMRTDVVVPDEHEAIWAA